MVSAFLAGIISLPEGSKEIVTAASMLPFLEVESLLEKCRSMVIATPSGFQRGEGAIWPWHLPCLSDKGRSVSLQAL